MVHLRAFSGDEVPFLAQSESAECGLACLAMIAGFHGHDADMFSMRRRFSVSSKGLNLAQLIQAAAKLHLSSRPVRCEPEFLHHLALPAILHWDMNHYVVLARVRRGRLTVHDPATGVRTVAVNEVAKHFTGVAVELQPTLRFVAKTERQVFRVRELLGRVRGLKGSLLQVFLLAFAMEMFGLLGPFLTQWVVDDALVSHDADLLLVLVIGILLLGCVRAAVAQIRGWVLLYLSTNLGLQWSSNVISHLLRLPMAFFERRHLGDIVSRLGAVANIQQTITTGFVGALIDGLMAMITLVMMLVYSPVLAGIAVGAVVLYAALRISRYGAMKRASEGQIVRAARQQSQLLESIRGVQALKLFDRIHDRVARYQKLNVETTNAAVEIQKLGLAFQTANALLVSAEAALVLFLASRFVLGGTFTIGMVMAFVSYKDQFTSRISSLVDKAVDLKMLRIQAERLSDIVLTKPEPVEIADGRGSFLEPSIEVRGAGFRYGESEAWVFRDVSFHVNPGESVVVVGPSGCGKTTLLKILVGQLVPDEGQVFIGGKTLAQIGSSQSRSLVGVVMQEDFLFAGSIAENISFFDPTPDHAFVEECARVAHIDREIAAMPMGFQTFIGDMGAALSGGQRQRILLARALYKRPRLLFLDEATSHLDAALERSISAAIAGLNLTRVIIAHRPETIAAAGRVVRLEKTPARSAPIAAASHVLDSLT
jgi:ATP-binding cassette subfamily B protein RaxB